MDTIGYIFRDAVELGLIWSLFAIGVFISYRVLDFADLTAESSIVTGGAIAARLIVLGCNPLIALFVAFIGGGIAGLITGLLHTKLKIPAILAGIISMTGLYSINLRIMTTSNISLIRNTTLFSQFREFMQGLFNMSISGSYFNIMISIVVLVIICFVLYFFFGTEVGISLRSTGINQNMSRAQGINTKFMIVLGLVLSNALISLSGALLVQQQGYSDITMGRGTIVIGLASIIIGEAILGRKTFKRNMLAVILGSFLYQLLYGIAINYGLNPNDLKLIASIIIVLLLIVPIIKDKSIKSGKLKERNIDKKDIIEEYDVVDSKEQNFNSNLSQEDLKKVKRVIKLINKIKIVLTPETSKNKIEKARNSYDELNDYLKSEIKNYNLLVLAEERCVRLNNIIKGDDMNA